MWAWIPTNSTMPSDSRADRRWAARFAAPDARPNPNLESSCPVWMYSWVCTSIPGVTRASTLGRTADGPPFDSDTSCSMRSISSNESMTIRPTPADRAAASSPSDLLLPCRTSRSGGTPAASATWSSPPVDTSRYIPSSSASLAMARHKKALVA
jgi:hypothetical protein